MLLSYPGHIWNIFHIVNFSEKWVCDIAWAENSLLLNYQAASQISHILAVTGHVGSENLLEHSLNVSSEGTSLLGWRAIRGLVVSFQLLCTVIQGSIYFSIGRIVYPAINSKKNSYYIRICKFEAKRLKIRVDIKHYMSQRFYNNISSIFDRRGSLHQIQVIWQVYCNDVNKLKNSLRTKSTLFVYIWNRRLSSFS